MLSKMNSFIDKKDFVSQVKVKCDNRPNEFYRKHRSADKPKENWTDIADFSRTAYRQY